MDLLTKVLEVLVRCDLLQFQLITHNISTDSVDFGQLAKINRICWNVVSDQLKIQFFVSDQWEIQFKYALDVPQTSQKTTASQTLLKGETYWASPTLQEVYLEETWKYLDEFVPYVLDTIHQQQSTWMLPVCCLTSLEIIWKSSIIIIKTRVIKQ